MGNLVSVIIPTLNEEKHIGKLLEHLLSGESNRECEIICVDAGSSDATQEIVKQFPEVVLVKSDQKHRAVQMNLGAQKSMGDVLYFVHADTIPPLTFRKDVVDAWGKDKNIGCYPFEFNGGSKRLKMNSFFTQFPMMISRGGDQTLFVDRELFDELEGFDESYDLMEEYDFIRRARKKTKFHILKTGKVLVSDRKYDHNSYSRINFANALVFFLFNLGVAPSRLKRLYFRLINHPKAQAEL